MHLFYLLLLPVLGVSASPYGAFEKRQNTVTDALYAQTCISYSTVINFATSPISGSCAFPTVSGPRVTQDCYYNAFASSCAAATTSSSCTGTLTTTTNIFNVRSTFSTTVCTTNTYPPSPAAVLASTTSSSRSSSSLSLTRATTPTGSASTGSAATGSSSTSRSITGSASTGSSSTGRSATGSVSTGSASTGRSVAASSPTGTSPAGTSPTPNNSPSGTSPVTNPSSSCFADNINNQRTFTGGYTTSNSMTNGFCTSYCSNLGFPYSGTEYGGECYCSATAPTVSSSGCTTTCNAVGSTEICGGPNALSVSYNAIVAASVSSAGAAAASASANAASWTSQGCYGDHYPTRVLSGASTTASSSMTVVSCINFCDSGSFVLAGLEYGNECYCGNTILTDGSTYGTGGQTGCTFRCAGNNAQFCGASNFINLYSKSGTVTSNFTSPNGGTPVASTGPTVTPSTVAGSSGYAYVNAFVDSTSNRVLSIQQTVASVTVENCITSCNNAGYQYAGVEYGSQCFCGQSILNNPTGGQQPTMGCQGNPAEFCGGQNVIQIYQGAPNPQYLTAPFPNGQCATDYTNFTRILTGATSSGPGMTPQVCRVACQGFTYFGVEYANECYCGNSFPSQTPLSSGCAMSCAGDSSQICGGPNALNMYNS